jgi:hypothetical protein
MTFSGMIMRHILRALSLLLSIFPVTVFAAPPCDLIDREVLIALKLDNPKLKAEHREIPASKDLPKQDLDSCTVAPRDLPLPSLTVMTATLPANTKLVKPSCNWNWIPGMEIGTCTATVNDTLITFAVTAKSSSDTAMKTTFSSQVERIVNRLATSDSRATPPQ